MRLDEISKSCSPLAEGPFDDIVSQLSKVPKKGPGRWPNKKDTSGTNYSGDKANDRNGYGHGVGKAPVRKKELDQLKGPGPSRIKKTREATGDANFDDMMGKITGSDKPTAQLGNKPTVPDRKIMALTHQIFLKLRDYDDPDIYQKFIEFMIKTVNDNVGPLDESKFR